MCILWLVTYLSYMSLYINVFFVALLFYHSPILFSILQFPADMAKSKAYILDPGIAGLILDGELWSREPGLLVRYHTDLQATLLHPDSKLTLGDLEGMSSTVQRAMNAWKWTQNIIQTQESTGTKLFVTPTVQNELSDALQVCTCM